MGGFLFQYGTAVHLALLTVAPLFLCAFCGPSDQVFVSLGLSFLAVMWVVMNPSPRVGEWPRDARHRIGWELAHDPFLALGGVALVFSAIRAVNGGIAMNYDASAGIWRLKEPFLSLLPGSVSGAGVLPLIGVFGLVVVTLGVRHALGARARHAYLLLSGFLAALAVVVWCWLTSTGRSVPRLFVQPEDPFHPGSLLGVYFLFATVSWVESWSRNLAALELAASLSVAVLLAGLVLYAPPFTLWVFGLDGLLIMSLGLVLSLGRRPVAAWFRTAIAVSIIVVPTAFLILTGAVRSLPWPVFREGALVMRETASAVAVEAWKTSPRLGVGLGSYPLALGFFAKPEDWQILSVAQTAAPNGWIHFLFERGFLGVVVALAGLVIMLRDAIVRYLRTDASWSFSVMHAFAVFVLMAVAVVTFFECSYVQPEALMPVLAALALTAAAFPESSEADHG